MKIKYSWLLFVLIFLISCSSEGDPSAEESIIKEQGKENSGNSEATDNGNEAIESFEILLSIEELAVLSENDVEITIPENADYDAIKTYLNSELIDELSGTTRSFNIDIAAFEDGEYQLKIEVLNNGSIVASKTIVVKIDKTGPTLELEGVLENQIICEILEISPTIVDLVSGVSTVSVFVDDNLLQEFSGDDEISFVLDTKNIGLGPKRIALIMEDVAGNITEDTFMVVMAEKVLNVNFPAGFIRPSSEIMHVILSDAEGNYLGSSTHSSGLAETLEICSTKSLELNEDFMLTFFRDFSDSVFFLYSYHNLTLENFGNEISLSERALGKSAASITIDLPDYQDGDYVRAVGPWSSGFNYASQNVFYGDFSRDFTVDGLGTDKMFIMNFKRDVAQSYSYAFIDNPHTIFELEAADFITENVINDNLQVQGTNRDPYLSIYGFENTDHFNGLVNHMLYWNSNLNRSNNYDYSYADIFYDVFHSIKVSNYSIEGLGHPPALISVPGDGISYTFSNNTLNLNGLPGYDVGRAQLRNLDDAHIFLEIYFDGQSDQVVVPKIPESIASAKLKDVIDNNRLNFIQCVVEKYSGLSSYDEYVSQIVVPSVPFYTVSPSRERIFKSSVSTSLIPMTEWPFYARF